MRKFLLMTVLFVGFTLTGWAQNESKLSWSTQLFLNERDGSISLERDTKAEKNLGLVRIDEDLKSNKKMNDRLIAKPDTINGKAYIAAFIRLNDNTNVSELEALGVEIQCTFKNGLITANIPVDQIEAVAAISNVKRVKVAQLMRKTTNKARQATNVDDALTQSTDAISAGLSKVYDGTGVVLGVIDTGIDFNHIAFKDANGNSRIKKAYVYNGSKATEYSSISSSTLTDDNSEDHGTHTSSTAGGSSVIVSGSNVTVTSDHSKATYGGMAPGADLYLAGIKGLSDTYIANAFQKICNYADGQNQPVVVNNSWGGQFGPHDGTGDVADVVSQYFGDAHPNHICLFASSNDAGKSKDGEGGGYHVSGTASSSSPLRSILRSASYSNTDAGYYYYGIIANAWARSTSVSSMTCKIYVLDSSTGGVKTSVSVTPSANGASVSGLSSYFSGTLYAYKDYVSSNKTQIMLYTSGLTSKSTSTTTKNGSTYYKSNYTLAVEFAPSSGSSVIDVWGGAYCYFTNHLSTSGYTWTAGSDDMSVSDEATDPNVISIGAYVTNNTTPVDYSSVYTLGDIAYFSSYATASQSLTGLQYPWITAPGARLIAGVNHNHTTSVDNYSYYGSDYGEDMVVNNSSNPYAAMEGTSMATPVAAGIVALWLQAASEMNKDMTTSDIKAVMKETAINDSYTTTGSNASHFGNGKIDALAGLQYILGVSGGPKITADPDTLEFTGYATVPQTQEITVTGMNLEGNITASISGSNVFSIDKTTITQNSGAAEATITVTWSPTTAGTTNATLTLKSQNADDVTVSLTGTAEAATPTIVADKESLSLGAVPNMTSSQTVTVTSRFLTGNVTATLTDANGVFAVNPTSFTAGEEGTELTISFSPTEEGNYSATLILSSDGAADVVIPVTAVAKEGGTASDPYLDIAQYATIDDAGWRTAMVNNLYKYTEYEDDECAWLTLPVYGAFVGARYATDSSTIGSGNPQAWIQCSLDNQNTYGGVPWDSSDIFAGSATYFTSATARAIGYNSQNNTTIRNVSFYVTNATAVKLYGTGRSGVSDSYPAALKVYECTMNADGSVTAVSTATKNLTSTSTSTFTLDANGLDVSKIYKVEASIYRGYLYEIAFQTPIEVDRTPRMTADPATLSFACYATQEDEQTFTVKGKYLVAPVNATLNDGNDAFTLKTESASADEGNNGATFTVAFTPSEAGEYSATITIQSEGAEDVTVTLTGTAEAATPTILTETTSLDFIANVDSPSSKEITINGRFLAENVTATLTDPKHVFSVSPVSVEVTEEGATITVTFEASAEGNYTGTLTLSSLGAEDVTIALSATANDGGTASDPYLNIAKYATIDEAGWNTSYVNKLYAYTEYEDDECAWLTLPVYGAFVGAKYATNSSTIGSGQPQKWIESNVTSTNNKYAGTIWNSSDVLNGSSTYFTTANARAMGYNSRMNLTLETVTFYVTNTTAVKLLGTGQTRSTSTYPASLKIYECTVNSDGSLSAATTATKSYTNSATSGTFILSASDLDSAKIYKVVAGTYRSYLCEIAFQTPLKKETTLIGDVNRDGSVSIADVTALVDIILGKITDTEAYDFVAADVNEDGSITIADVTALVDLILGK